MSRRPGPRATNVPPLTHMQSGLVSVDWDSQRPVLNEDGWCVYTDSTLAEGEVFIDRVHSRSFLSPALWQRLHQHGPALVDFIDDYTWCQEDGMRFVVTDAGSYGEAARREAAAVAPAPEDRLKSLRAQAQSFVVQAASLNERATPGQARMFAVRYARLRAELAAIEQELEAARTLVDLAGSALVDATVPTAPTPV